MSGVRVAWPQFPGRGGFGAKEIRCPFTGERLSALPALYAEVAAIHVHEADRFGNCRFRGTSVADLDLARASER